MTRALVVLGAVVVLFPVLIVSAVMGALSSLFGGGASQPSAAALSDIPAAYLALYRTAAGVCPGLDWSVLAAIGKIETNHGRSPLPGVHTGENHAGAAGPMQFLAATFAAVTAQHPIPPGGATPPSRYHPHDAIHAAAYYLCDNGARHHRDLHGAIYAYNHADWYVTQVLDQAAHYRTTMTTAPHGGGWVVPVQGRCTSRFGPRDGEFHRGLDISAPIGTPIRAAAEGTVLNAGPATGYGLWVRIQHPDGVITTYGHNHRNLTRPGDHVQAGQVIAEVGNRGESTGPHLHFQIDTHGQPTDPAEYYRREGIDVCNHHDT
ncbi:peptidoglycan DD-metalloendopeptidase family protein [Saccharopolyspora hirsuta]|uniref:Peptidoglycan DD-metalloendopeptidase family protein n=1 Tax=Saccharopolyspora hirsuta TaxID=1837 RepID=A0A5M7B9P0_SACHI|nr:peptidoglycan DD-metalloendopeptidase family protein [Saccharopolyspora hirsuta]KAA5825430.1 peptidoglycan DD-metalloendopeptidase family protein [Saccharopolyspora hirsuta]